MVFAAIKNAIALALLGVGLTYAQQDATGFQDDVTKFFNDGGDSFKKFLLANISPNVGGALPGSIIAATASEANNYVYHWIRDSALVMDVVNTMYKGGDSSLESTIWDHAAFTKRIQGLKTLTSLGEAKYLVTGEAFNEPWCRPQNDGPALRASFFIRFAHAFLDNGGDKARIADLYNGTAGVIKDDLEYVTRTYDDANGCDLWEEERGIHFFTVASQRRAMHEGRDFAKFMGDTGAAAYYSEQASILDAKMDSFWNADQKTVQTTLNGRLLDAALTLGAIHGNVGDGVMAPEDDRMLSSIYSMEHGFINEYSLNQNTQVNAEGLPLSVALGRYFNDVYDGAGTGLGNPWYLTTLASAETIYRATTAFVKAGSIKVTELNQRLFNGAAPAGLGLNIATGTYASDSAEFKSIVANMKSYADKHVRRIQYHGAADFHFNEQFNRDNGFSQGVNDLTWSYASIITTSFAREELMAASP